MGHCKPFYGVEEVLDTIKEIAKVDEKINALAIEREELVKKLEKQIKEINTIKD